MAELQALQGDDVDGAVAACKALALMNVECQAVSKLLSHKEPRASWRKA